MEKKRNLEGKRLGGWGRGRVFFNQGTLGTQGTPELSGRLERESFGFGERNQSGLSERTQHGVGG